MRRFNVTVNGTNYEVVVDEVVGGASAPVAAAPVQSAPVAQAAPAPAPVAAPAGAGEPLTSPMPGLVKELRFKNGDTVKKGEAVLILEAMKMDNDIAASKDGVITYSVSSGANVNSGDVLCTIA